MADGQPDAFILYAHLTTCPAYVRLIQEKRTLDGKNTILTFSKTGKLYQVAIGAIE